MPIPGTNIKWPWESDPAPPPDTALAESVVGQLAAGHGGVVGQPAKNIPDDKGKPTDLSRYSFGDGSSLEIKPDGSINDWTPKGTGAKVGWTDFTQIRNPDQTITYYGKDPADGTLKPVPGLPTSAAPESVKTAPSALGQFDKIDKNGNDATQSGLPPVSLRDPKTGSVIDIPKDPAGSVTAVGDNFYVIKPDGSSTLVTDATGKPIAKTKDPSQFNVPGIGLVNYDPSSGKANVLISAPTGVQARDLKPEVRGGKTYIPIDNGQGGITWQETNLPSDTTYSIAQNDARSPNVLLIDQQGNSKFVSKGPDWKPPPSPQAGQALTPDTTAPHIVTIGDDGKPVFTDNPNRLSINDAQKQLIQQLGIKVANGDMSEDAAQKLITSATQSMTAQAAMINAQANQQQQVAQTGGAVLQGIQQGAQTGAGILQNRVSNAQQMLGSVLGLAGQGQRSGNMGGGLMSAPAGLGEALVGGIQGWATELGGGPDVYQSAANLVQRADPGSKLGGDAANAYGVLGQMLQKYRDLTGQPHPAETIAAQQQANAGFNAPTTVTPEQQIAQNVAAGQLSAATTPASTPFGAIGANPMLSAQQAYNRQQAAQQLQAATAQASPPFGAVAPNPWANAAMFVAPTTVAPPTATVTA